MPTLLRDPLATTSSRTIAWLVLPSVAFCSNLFRSGLLALLFFWASPSAYAQTAPGCVPTNLQFWLKADAGITPGVSGTTVAAWLDQSTNAFSLTQTTAASQPLSGTALLNYNPAVNFNGSKSLTRAGGIFPAGTINNVQVFVVSQLATVTNNYLFQENVSTGTFGAYIPNGSDVLWDANGSGQRLTASGAGSNLVGVPTLWSLLANVTPAQSQRIFENGQLLSADATMTSFVKAASPVFNLGGGYNGLVAEMVTYTGTLSASQQNRIETYLGLKYGLTLANDYVSSSGAVVYDVSAYANNVAGIGREVCQGLNQKQSRSVNPGFQVTLSASTTIAASNAANTGTLVDGTFEMWGDNGLSTSYGVTYSPTSFTSAATFSRMSRVWQVQETGSVGAVTVSVLASSGAERLLVGSSAAFGAGTQEILLTPDGQGNLTASVNLASGQFFTFGRGLYAPGCVTANLAWWFKGDVGVTSSGSVVTGWSDFGTTGLDLTQATATSQPSYTALQNYNPIVSFDGSNDYLRNAAGFWKSTTGNNQYNTFVVTTNHATGGVNAVFGENTAQGTQTLFLPYSGNAYNGFWSGYLSNSTLIGTTDTPYLWSGQFNNSSSPKVNSLSRNGVQLAATTSTIAFNGNNSPLEVGASAINGWYAHNDIAEILMYSADLTLTQRQQIESYLALKWGLTLGHNYLSSTGAILYPVSSYSANVAGIGRDDCQNLNQKQSTSVNDDFQVTLSISSNVALSNAANLGSFSADQSFEVWGDNGLSTSYGVSYSPVSFTTAATFALMNRVWQVQETGTVGAVTVGVPASSGAERLLVGSSAAFGAGTQELLLTPDGQGNLTASVNLTSGQFFTFGRGIYAPGCVTASLAWWFKGDVGVTTSGSVVAGWSDFGTTGLDLTQATATNQPSYTALQNYNPIVSFDGSNDYLSNAAGFWKSTTGNQQYNTFVVTTSHTTGGVNAVFGENTPQGTQTLFMPYGGNAYNGFWSSYLANTTLIGTVDTPYLWTGQFNNSSSPKVNSISRNGTSLATTTSTIAFSGNNSPLEVGASAINGWYAHNDIAEILMYSADLTLTQRQQIESYLAIKWGLTLEHNYLSSSGGTLYNVSSYSANVAGIGRDDCQGLNQKQSTSINLGAQVTLSASNTVAASNAANSATLVDGSFEVWGDNGLSTAYGVSYSPVSFTTAATFALMNRVWQVQETGTVGAVTVSIPSSLGAERLLVSSSAAFGAGTQEILLTPDGQGNLTASVNLTSGQFFTFGRAIYAPGCVTGALQLWFKADAGVTTSGTAVTGWLDQSPVSVPASQTVAANQPSSGTALVNFNPAIQFDGTNDYLGNTSFASTNLFSGKNNYSLLTVLIPDRLTGVNAAISFNTDKYLANNAGAGSLVAEGATHTTTPVNLSVGLGGITTFVKSTTLAGGVTSFYNGSSVTLGTTTPDVDYTTNRTGLGIGSTGNASSASPFGGRITEVIAYSTSLTVGQRQSIESYLALKYGITLKSNYVTSTGTVVYPVSSYSANIAGLGREDCQALNQKQSQSINDGFQVTMSGSSTIATTNAANSATLVNGSFEVWGDNGLATSFGVAYSPVSFTTAATFALMNRVWQVQETGTVGAVTVGVPAKLWKDESGIFDQYRYGDFNMDADANFSDSVLWKKNNGRYSKVPH